MNEEIWKPVVGFNGYEVSDIGNVRSWKNNQCGRRLFPKILRPRDCKGYLANTLLRCSDKKFVSKCVHILVLEAFVCKRPTGLQACHNDGNRLNNSVENLRWDTCQNNHKDRIKHGTSNPGVANSRAKLTVEDVLQIRHMDTLGVTTSQLMAKFEVCRSAIRRLLTNRTYQNV